MSQQEILTVVAEVTLEDGGEYEAIGRLNVAGLRAMPDVDGPELLRAKTLELLRDGVLMRVGVAIDPAAVTYRESTELFEVDD